MKFYPNQLFHVCNQGNNQRQLFFSDEDYLFFLWRMRGYLLPFCDIIGWSLMPNHFHWLLYVKEIAIQRKTLRKHADTIEYRRRVSKYKSKAKPVRYHAYRKADSESLVTINEAIGTIEKSYTAMLNKQMGWSGSVFRRNPIAKDGWIDEFITTKNYFHFQLGNDYGARCLEYIHENAQKAGIVKNALDYQWSSARDYAGLRNGDLCAIKLGRQLLNILP